MGQFKLLESDKSEKEAPCNKYFSCFTWNIEGLKRNVHSLKHFVDLFRPELIFLSEPQLHHCDLKPLISPLQGQYSSFLNSEDFHHPELALEQSKPKGGTMVLWKNSLDPFITVMPTSTPSVSVIVFKSPSSPICCHITIYLPTSGQENEFVSALSDLDSCIDQIKSSYLDPYIFIRGDANVNPKNTSRSSLFKFFLQKHNLDQVEILHPTYHHFLGSGEFDSCLDIILHTSDSNETVNTIICKNQDPLILSHHDLIISSFTLPVSNESVKSPKATAPRISNDRVRIIWSEEGIANYQVAVGDNLTRLRNTWCQPSSPAMMSILLQSTYSVLSTAASSTNKVIPLGMSRAQKSKKYPEIEAAKRNLLEKHRSLKSLLSSATPDLQSMQTAKIEHSEARSAYRQAVRAEQAKVSKQRDQNLLSIRTSNSSSIFKTIKGFKSVSSGKIHELCVNDKIYRGDMVPDGFFDSLSALKSPDMSSIHSFTHFGDTLCDFRNILKICQTSSRIPEISYKKSAEILLSLRSDVNDFYSITANHFVNAGKAGFEHFFFLLNSVLKNIQLASMEELNTVWACILFKGHGKNKHSDRSYRTISTCPLLAKALDTYIGQLYGSAWAAVQ